MNLHLYHYAGNNPIKYVDPDGREDDLTQVVSPCDGDVVAIYNFGDKSDYGNMIVIKDKDGNYNVFAHLEKSADGLKVGSVVTQGQVIATAGGTGRTSTASHLHWTVISGVSQVIDKKGTDGVFIGNWIINVAKSIDPLTLIDSGKYIYPVAGEITSYYGDRKSIFPDNPKLWFHEVIDFSLTRKRS